ncbi:hypothetical protein ACH5RR_004850 [Cinchona calisaya]|uniref:RING-type E3 ubiquitin transferase n=1 Tax=Cinchona calisaya TaxID=153742 RepID=A0ABD3AZJ4_9GENT
MMMMMMSNNSTTTTVNIPIANNQSAAAPPPQPSQGGMSPLTAILSLLILIAVPALIYAFFFAISCPRIQLIRRPRRRSELGRGPDDEFNSTRKDTELACTGGAVKYRKEADHEEEYGSECPVCLSGFNEGDYVRQLDGCKHSFHVGCIDKWLSFHSNCPVCRASVTTPPSKQNPLPAGDADFRQGLPDAASLV